MNEENKFQINVNKCISGIARIKMTTTLKIEGDCLTGKIVHTGTAYYPKKNDVFEVQLEDIKKIEYGAGSVMSAHGIFQARVLEWGAIE